MVDFGNRKNINNYEGDCWDERNKKTVSRQCHETVLLMEKISI